VARTNGQPGETSRPSWTFLTNHGHVLVCIATDPEVRGRDIAERVGITERAAQAIIADLVKEGYVVRTRIGRRNRYEINLDRPMRHPVEQPHNVGELLKLVARITTPRARRATAS
jgi:predicted transcriptional regulator